MKVKETLIYKGKMYEIGSDIVIIEKDVLENCLKRGLIFEEEKEITKAEEETETDVQTDAPEGKIEEVEEKKEKKSKKSNKKK